MLEKIPIPILSKNELEGFKFLIIGYNNEKYIRWVPFETESGFSEHSSIETAFKEELKNNGLPINLGEITGDIALIYPEKRIMFTEKGSRKYKNADFELFKILIRSEHPDYEVFKDES